MSGHGGGSTLLSSGQGSAVTRLVFWRFFPLHLCDAVGAHCVYACMLVCHKREKTGGGLLRLMEPISRAIQQSDHTLPILHSPSILFPISLSPPLCCFSLNLTLIKWINQWQHQSWTDSITPLGLAACMFVHWSLVHERKNEGKTRIKSGIQMVTKDERLRAKGTSRMRERKPDTK